MDNDRLITHYSIVWQNQSRLAFDILVHNSLNSPNRAITIDDIIKLTRQLTRVAVNPPAYFQKMEELQETK